MALRSGPDWPCVARASVRFMKGIGRPRFGQCL
jgi:hypothetical protein